MDVEELKAIMARAAARWVEPEMQRVPKPRVYGVPAEAQEVMRWTVEEVAAKCRPSHVATRAAKWPRLPTMLVLAGPYRVGKTVLGSWLLGRESARLERSGYWVKAEELCLRARASFNLSEDVRRALDAPLLLLDDVGTELSDEQACGIVRTIITTRHAARKPTIVTTGLTHQQRAARYGSGVADRLSPERNATVVLNFKQEDAR